MIREVEMCAFSECFLFEMFHLLDSNTQIYLDKNFFFYLYYVLVYIHVFVYYTSTKSWRGYIFNAVCLCVCLSVCVCPAFFLWTKFQPNRYTDLDAIFTNRLLSLLARTLLKLVTLGQRLRSLWQKMYLKLMKNKKHSKKADTSTSLTFDL